MRVAINARLLAAPTLRGWNRYTVNLLAELPALGIELLLYTDRPIHDSHLTRLPVGSYQVRTARQMRYPVWEQYWVPRQLVRDGADLFHCPLNFGLPWLSPCPRVLTLHDAIDSVFYRTAVPLRNRLRLNDLKARLFNWVARSRADLVITVSEHAKSDLVEHLRLPAEKIVVIYEAADARFHATIPSDRRMAVRAKHRLSRPYVFYVGGLEPRKNIPFLLRAFATADLGGAELVLAGGTEGERVALQALASSSGIEHRVRILGWVDDDDLPALYAEALCFVYPSQYEGFGLQLCEAMAAGCPTLAAHRTSLPEVLGDGGATFSLTEGDGLSTELSRIASDSGYRASLAASARQRAGCFSWRRSAEQTVAVYERLARSSAELA